MLLFTIKHSSKYLLLTKRVIMHIDIALDPLKRYISPGQLYFVLAPMRQLLQGHIVIMLHDVIWYSCCSIRFQLVNLLLIHLFYLFDV